MAETTRQFIHLRVRSEYSLYDSTIKLTEYVKEAKRRGLTHLSVADGNLFAAPEFCQLCRQQGIHPIIGCDFHLAFPSDGLPEEGARLILLAENNQGYRNLLKLNTHYYLGHENPALTDAFLKEYHQGLIAITGGMIDEGRLRELKGIFAQDNLFIGVDLVDGEQDPQRISAFTTLGARSGIPLVAAHPVHYLHQEDASSYCTLRKIGLSRGVVDDTQAAEVPDYFRTGKQMEELFSEIPEAIGNSIRIAQRCSARLPSPAPAFPQLPLPPDYASEHEYLEARVAEGLISRYCAVTDEVTQKVQEELESVRAVGYSAYFLILADMVDFARRQGIPVGPGRGAAAGFLINYALGITDVDPLKHGLLSERFLNPERIATPDIDMDFCYERRGEVIQYVRDTYGQDHTAHIITFGRYKARSAVRDTGRVMGLSFQEIASLVKKIPPGYGVSIKHALEEVKELSEEVARGSLIGKVLQVAQVIESLPRDISTHAAGIALSRESMDTYLPLYRRDGWEGACTQFRTDQLEEAGVVSFDLLGFKVLTLLHHCQEKIREKHQHFYLSRIPEDDEKSFSLLGEGETTGVFQCESSGMKELLRKAKPQSLEELAAISALYRPGAMEMIPKYLEAKQAGGGREGPTGGLIIFQEQIMEIAHTVALWSYGKADILRRILGKREARSMEAFQKSFLLDAGSNGYSRERAAEVFELLSRAAPFAALKAHIVSYSLLAYRSTFLKAHYPQEYMESLLYLERDNPARYEVYERAAEEMGVR